MDCCPSLTALTAMSSLLPQLTACTSVLSASSSPLSLQPVCPGPDRNNNSFRQCISHPQLLSSALTCVSRCLTTGVNTFCGWLPVLSSSASLTTSYKIQVVCLQNSIRHPVLCDVLQGSVCHVCKSPARGSAGCLHNVLQGSVSQLSSFFFL